MWMLAAKPQGTGMRVSAAQVASPFPAARGTANIDGRAKEIHWGVTRIRARPVPRRTIPGCLTVDYRRKTRCAGEPTGMYCPVKVSAPDFVLIRKLVMASDRWLQENRNCPDGSMVKLRG